MTQASTCVNPTSVNDKPWRMIWHKTTCEWSYVLKSCSYKIDTCYMIKYSRLIRFCYFESFHFNSLFELFLTYFKFHHRTWVFFGTCTWYLLVLLERRQSPIHRCVSSIPLQFVSVFWIFEAVKFDWTWNLWLYLEQFDNVGLDPIRKSFAWRFELQ